jgi:hypothetical protein
MIGYRKYTFIALALSFCSMINNHDFFDLRKNAQYDRVSLDNSCLYIQNYPKHELNYVKTLLYTWKRVQALQTTDSIGYFSQALGFVGDVQNVNALSQAQETWINPYLLSDTSYINKFKRLECFEAKEFILESFKGKDIVMINEAHDRPQTRAFITSLLKDLKEAGVTHLAMETFSENENFAELDCTTGYFTQEPSSGEIVREALSLGYKLVPYEDYDLMNHTLIQRDSIQAKKLYDGIKKNSGEIEKTLVVAGYRHIAEAYDPTFVTMAMNFKKISKINPLTIDQVQLIENNDNVSYPYNRILDTAFNNGKVLAFTAKSMRAFDIDTNVYDICLYHPKTTYTHNRPSWLINLKEKQFFSVAIPESIKPVLVQAYLSAEIINEKDFQIKIPCDQTFYSENNKVWFALRKGREYKIVFRNEDNKILKTKLLKP